MLFRTLLLSLLLITGTNTTFATTFHHLSRQQFIRKLLQEPVPKLKRCAKKGYLVYQNSLALLYLSGHLYLDSDEIKAYAWAQVALDQLEGTHNPILIRKQTKYIHFIGKRLSRKARFKALHLAKTYEMLWGKNWPHPPILDFTRIEKSCQL